MRRCPGWQSPWTRVAGYALIGLLVFGAYAWSGQFLLDMVDEGYFLDLAARVDHGQLPYRDFDTYYTPGVFYLFAAILHVFGASVLPIRLAMAAIRALAVVLIVRLTVRWAPWPFALLPVLTLLALDRWPIEPEPHPAWPALVASLLAMEALALHQGTTRSRWLVLAGAAAALAFLFKQNVGAFAALGIGGYVIFRHRADHGWSTLGFAALVAIAVSVLLWPGLAPFSVLALLLPVLVALAAAATRTERCAGRQAPLVEIMLVTTPFVLLTAMWIAPLAAALRPYPLPVGLFVGAVNQAGLASPYPNLSPGAKVLLQLTVLAAGAATKRWTIIGLAAGVALSLQVAPTTEPGRTLTDDPQLAPVLGWLDDWFGTLHLYLPTLAAWTAVVVAVVSRRRLAAGGAAPPWAVLFAALSLLALYPRLDAPHVIVALPAVLIVATAAIGLGYAAMLSSVRRPLTVGVGLLVLAVPLAAVAPQAVWRYTTLSSPPGQAGAGYEALGLTRASVRMPAHTAQAIRSVVDYVASGTPPDAPFFAYPAAPMFNFLVDRPNPTRFDHFFAGALTDADLHQVVNALESTRPRYVLWDHFGVTLWETDPANRVLSDYIWRCYDIAATFDLYLVLERHAC